MFDGFDFGISLESLGVSPRNLYLNLQSSKGNAQWFFLRSQGIKMEMFFLVGK